MAQQEEAPYTFEMRAGLAGVWTMLSLVLFVAAAASVGLLYSQPGHAPDLNGPGLLLWLLAFLAVLPLHELVHAALMRLFGGRPRFGAGIKTGMPYLYVADPGRRFSRDQFVAIGMAPLLVIDLTALALLLLVPAWSWPGPALVTNTSGAIGDLWMVGVLLRFPRSAIVEDRTTGFAVWAAPGTVPIL